LSKRKKRKNNRRVSKIVAKKLSPQQLKLQAQQALSNTHYKTAIQCLKTLLKKEAQSESIVTLLQQAYTGRAKELAEKGMLKEAIGIWDVGLQYGLDPVDLDYLEWIISSRQYHRLGKIYPLLETKDKHDLQPRLAAICLSGDLSVLEILAEDDPVRSGYQVANKLLEAWCAGEDEAQLQKHMKVISFRSPYRDLRQVIQAWLIMEKSPQQAVGAVQRITKASPFYPLAQQILLVQLDIADFVRQLSSLTLVSRNCALNIRGWTDTQSIKILKKLEQQGRQPSLKTLSNTLLSLCKQLTGDRLSSTVKYWLHSTAKKAWMLSKKESYCKLNFNQLGMAVGTLTTLEKYHYEYLSIINNNKSLPYISRGIESYLKELELTPNTEIKKADRLLMSAILNRYLVDRWEECEGKLTDKSFFFLQQSLKDDPSDDQSWAKLLEYYLQQKELKSARDALKDALDHHPDNIKLLDLAVRIAIAGNAFVKAANYAKRILQVDPINSSAQQHLQHAHLSHARKQFKHKKWHLVHKELDQARKWKGTVLTETLIEVLQAFQIQAEKGVREATSAFQALTEIGHLDKVAIDFIIRHQGIQINYAYGTSLKSAKLRGIWRKPNKEKILVLIDIVQQLMKVDPASITEPLNSLSAPLKKAAKLPFTAAEGERVCEFLMQVEENALLKRYSLRLGKKHKNHPVFDYYFFVNDNYLNYKELNRLENAWEIAKDLGDEATSSRIVGLLQKHSTPFANSFFEKEDDWDWVNQPNSEEMDAMMSAIVALEDGSDIDEKEKGKIIANILPILPIKEIFDMADKFAGKRLAKLIQKELGDSGLRTFCQRCLRGEEPDDVAMDMMVNSDKNSPFMGGLF
jgi:tetratricopeptide (TPR) repeat protein